MQTPPQRSPQRLYQLFPGWQRLRHYRREWLRPDLLAGITVAAYLIPQCMAYGELAGVGAIAGLWAILPAMLVYAFLGSSPQISMGPESTTAVMTAVAIAPFASRYSSEAVSIAALLAAMVGLVCVGGYLGRLGFLANLLSKPILVGYLAGMGLIMIAGQLGRLSGVTLQSEPFFAIVAEWVQQWPHWHGPTVGLGLAVLGLLLFVQRRLPQAPAPLLGVLGATAVVAVLHLDQQGVAVVGAIPAGLPHWTWPDLRWAASPTLWGSAFGIALVGYSDTVLTARAFANRRGYEIDANQEWLALGVANLGAGFCRGMPLSSSGSRTVIGDAMGSKSQVFSLVAFGSVVLVLVLLRPLLMLFPKAALGAIVVFAAMQLIDLGEFRRLGQFRRTELALALVTTLGVISTNILLGVAIAVGLSVLDILARISRPHEAVQGQVPGLAGWHDIGDWPGATTLPGLVMYRFDAPLFFVNVEHFKQQIWAAIATETTPVRWLLLNTEAIVEIDSTAAEILLELQAQLSDRQITLALVRVKQGLLAQLRRAGLVERMGEAHIFPTIPTAIVAFQNEKSAVCRKSEKGE